MKLSEKQTEVLKFLADGGVLEHKWHGRKSYEMGGHGSLRWFIVSKPVLTNTVKSLRTMGLIHFSDIENGIWHKAKITYQGKKALKPQFDLIDWIIRSEGDGVEWEEYVDGFQYLVDSGLAWTFQGTYWREAMRLIESGDVIRK